MAKARKLKSGNWRVLVYDYTDPSGKRHYESITAETKKEAEYLAAEFSLNKKQRGANAEMTIGEALKQYCTVKSNVLSPSTLKEYRRMMQYSYSDISDIRIKAVTQELIQKWANDYAETHSPKSVRNAHGLLAAAFEVFAPEMRLRTTLPQKLSQKLYVPSDDDIMAVLEYFHTTDKDMELAVYLAAFGTLRRSEICALDATDIIDGHFISVDKAMVERSSNEWVIKTTKTVSSTRVVEMPDFVIAKCPKSGRLVNISPDLVTSRFAKALKKLDVKHFRFHDLRHYAASIMHAIGAPDQYIMQRGGWSSDKTLKAIYRGTIDEYTQKYNNVTMQHFSEMQHKMQHEKEKAK